MTTTKVSDTQHHDEGVDIATAVPTAVFAAATAAAASTAAATLQAAAAAVHAAAPFALSVIAAALPPPPPTTAAAATSAGGGMPGPGLPAPTAEAGAGDGGDDASMAVDGGEVLETFQDFEAMGLKANAAAASGGGAADDDEFENPCPICLGNEDDAKVDGNMNGMCNACGQFYCGGCNTPQKIGQVTTCPTCRAPSVVSEEEEFKRCWKLVHDRSPGRHTPVAQCYLGFMYNQGKVVEQDHAEAVKWWQRAAEKGLADAQHNLGAMYNNGKGVEQDHIEAVKWFRCAAAQGHTIAQFNLGLLYGKGQGVPQDFAEALKWWQLAAEQGHEIALQLSLKLMNLRV